MNKSRKSFFKHLSFWIAFWFIQSLLFSGGKHFDVYLSKNVAIVMLQAALVYSNLLLLVRLLDQRRYALYTLSSLTLIYLTFSISASFIGWAFDLFLSDLKYIIQERPYWLPTDFWSALSGSAPYSIAFMGSTIFHLIRSRNLAESSDQQSAIEKEPEAENTDNTLMLKEGKVVHRLELGDILFIQGMKEYVSWHTEDKKVVTLHSLTSLEDLLSSKGFLRTHKSFIVNTKCVNLVKYDAVEIPGKRIPIGRSYRDRVQDRFKSDV